jgi:hypothetical protein
MPSDDGDGYAQVEVVALGAPLAERIAAAVTEEVMKTEPAPARDPDEVPVYMIASGMSGSTPITVGSVRDTFVEANYTDDVLRAIVASGKAIASEHPHGRLTIITGPTARFRDAIDRAGERHHEAFLRADDGLRATHRRRSSASVDRLSPMLTPGTSTSCRFNFRRRAFNVHVILTTNARVGRDLKIDRALQRKGRLAALVETDLLSPSHAGAVYRRLLPNAAAAEPVFDAPVSLADVYDKAIDDGSRSTPRRASGTPRRSSSRGGANSLPAPATTSRSPRVAEVIRPGCQGDPCTTSSSCRRPASTSNSHRTTPTSRSPTAACASRNSLRRGHARPSTECRSHVHPAGQWRWLLQRGGQ